MTEPVGIARGLTNYGDPDLRSSAALFRPLDGLFDGNAAEAIGIADTSSGFNNCHRHFPN